MKSEAREIEKKRWKRRISRGKKSKCDKERNREGKKERRKCKQ